MLGVGPGNVTALLKPYGKIENDKFQAYPGPKKLTYVNFTEKSVAARKKFVRGSHALNQMQQLFALTSDPLNPPEKLRKLYEGTNLGNSIGPTPLDHPSEQWNLTFENKKSIYGAHRHPFGGRGPGTPPPLPTTIQNHACEPSVMEDE